jgi:hypothetical protein
VGGKLYVFGGQYLELEASTNHDWVEVWVHGLILFGSCVFVLLCITVSDSISGSKCLLMLV